MTDVHPTHPVPMTECPRCRVEVPVANFCGRCGCRGGHLRLLRPSTFGAEPGEKVLRPFLASSLFPHLPDRSRTPFRITLAVAAAGLILAALMQVPAVGISIAALGLPVLFALYLRASAADRDCRTRSLIVAAGLGAVLGTGWVLACGHFVAQSFGVPMAVGLSMHHLFREGAVIPVIGVVLMVVPTVVVRLARPGSRESLDGFVIGALAGLAFSAAATLARLAPQVATGLIAHARPREGLLVEVILGGVTVPITAAAASGMVGIALWFRPRSGPAEPGGRVRLVLVLLTALALIGHAGVAVVDMVGLPDRTMLVGHLTATAAILLLLRIAMQLALLHELPDPIAEDRQLLCPRCEMVVPDMAFCPQCGAANRAASQQSRRERRERTHLADTGAGDGPGAGELIYPGYATPADRYAAPRVRRPRYGWLLGRWGTAITAVAVLLAGAALVLTPKVAHFMCPPECGTPPRGTPVMGLPRFTPPDGTFSVAYPAPGSAYTVSTTDSGVTATFTGGGGGVMQLFAEPAGGRPARDVVRAIVARTFPAAKVAYEIPNAMVGYQPGYGEVADVWPQSTTASSERVRILILAAVKNDLALVGFATGPYRAFGPDFGPGPPSGANLEIAVDMGKYVNSFLWRGDPAR